MCQRTLWNTLPEWILIAAGMCEEKGRTVERAPGPPQQPKAPPPVHLQRNDASSSSEEELINIQINSYGLENCVHGHRRSRAYMPKLGEDLTELMWRECKDRRGELDAYKFRYNNERHTSALIRRLMEEDEEKVSYRKCLIDCLNMDDPEHDPNLRDHYGYHPQTQENVATNLSDTEFMYMAEQLWEVLLGDYEQVLFVAICKKERHRSVAVRRLLYRYLREIDSAIADYTGRNVHVTLGREPFAASHMCTRTCPQCDLSSQNNPLRVHMFAAEKIFRERMTKAMCMVQQKMGNRPRSGNNGLGRAW